MNLYYIKDAQVAKVDSDVLIETELGYKYKSGSYCTHRLFHSPLLAWKDYLTTLMERRADLYNQYLRHFDAGIHKTKAEIAKLETTDD